MCDGDCFIKIFITPFILGPMIAAFCILLAIGIIGDILVILYFATIGWLCEIGIFGENEKCLVKGLTGPWDPFVLLLEKVGNFYSEPLSDKKDDYHAKY